MPLKGLIKEFREMKKSASTRGRSWSFDARIPYYHHYHRTRSQSSAAFSDPLQGGGGPLTDQRQGCWASLPPEILCDVIQRIEAQHQDWPTRKNVVACAAVCRSWRAITKELVKTPEQCGLFTFPISLKQPGTRDAMVHCFIKRDRTSATYRLFLSLTEVITEDGKFLMAARRVRRATNTDYIISLDASDMSRGSSTYVGKLRSNFLGTKFSVYDSQQPYGGAVASHRAWRMVGSKQVFPRASSSSSSLSSSATRNVAHIAYELNVLGTRGPRRMQCTVFSIPATSLAPGGAVPTPPNLSLPLLSDPRSLSSLPSFGSRSSALSEVSFAATESDYSHGGVAAPAGLPSLGDTVPPLVLKNKSPRWHEQLQCWCLNFHGRVTVASVKNFQLVAAAAPVPAPATTPAPPRPPRPPPLAADHEKVLLQFGKVGKDMFTMDYQYPLSAFQAFAICLSSFDTKLACE